MNSIEEHLTNALHRRDAELTVHDELDAILNGDRIVRFSHQRDTPVRRPLMLGVAAAAVIAVGAGGLIWAQRTEPSVPAAADAPQTALPEPATPATLPAAPLSVEPTAYPTLDEVPEGLAVSALLQQVPGGEWWTEALLGRTLDDGTIADTVAITVKATPFEISPMVVNPPVAAQVLGQTATVYDYGSPTSEPALVYVTWGSGPYFLASGPAPLDFLATITNDTFKVPETSLANEPPNLEFGPLPDGFAVVAEPAPFGNAFTGATLSIGVDNYDISVSTRNPVIAMSQSGPLRNVTVGDRPGWAFHSTSSQDLAWKVDDSTYAYLKVNVSTDPTTVLELAYSIRFVDQAEWRTRYEPTIDASTSTEAADAGPASVEAFCVEYASLQGERPETYVGSPEHVAAIEGLLAVAPESITADVAIFLDYLSSGAVDSEADLESNLTENWPNEVQNAVGSTQTFASENC